MRPIPRLFFSELMLLLLLLCGGCSSSDSPKNKPASSFSYEAGQTHVLIPEASGTITEEAAPLILDFSHTDQGYFIASVSDKDALIHIQVTGPDDITYKYYIEGVDSPQTLPLTAGDGSYLILALEQVCDTQYTPLLSTSIEVSLSDENLPYLYPNQYVPFTPESTFVSLAEELSSQAPTDLEALEQVYRYVTSTLTYDNEKAASQTGTYLPDLDQILETKKGICFDYAALCTAMLRVLSIPAKLEIGYTGDIRHAWIDVYVQSIGWVEKAVEFDGDEWKLMDPTFESTAKDSDSIRDYIGDGDNYTLEYIH